MRWWDRDGVSFSELQKGLAIINDAPSNAQQRYQSWVSALALFAKGYCWTQHPGIDGEGARIRRYFEDGAGRQLDEKFFTSPSLRALVTFSPRIADETVIDLVRRERRSFDLTDEEWERARRAHNEFVGAVEYYEQQPNIISRRNAARRLAQLLWIVRNNNDHSGKTPFGPDLEKARRDASVLGTALPVLEEVVLRMLDRPNQRLAVYGTLRKTEANHSIIADLGEPRSGLIEGEINIIDGLPYLRWANAMSVVPVEIYESSNLTAARWNQLDAFEGSSYKKILLPVRLEDDSHIVAIAYGDARFQ